MKALVNHRYGDSSNLQVIDIERPQLGPEQLLIKVKAASINGSDIEFMTGYPLYTRMWGINQPRFKILGTDIAGLVEDVGENVTEFERGQPVFGDIMYSWGGFAEYALATSKQIMPIPNRLSFEQAAAIPQASTIALQGLTNEGQVKSNHKVLINGAGGSGGCFAIQLAKYFGAHVTGIDNQYKQKFIRQLGADCSIDYQIEDFVKSQIKYDLIVDFIGNRSLSDYRKSLNVNGRYVLVGAPLGKVFNTLICGGLVSLFTSKKMKILAHHQNKTDLQAIIDLYLAGNLEIPIDKLFSLSQAVEAFRYLESGRAKGKVIIVP